MGLFSRGPAVDLRLGPAGPHLPTSTLTARVGLDGDVRGVTSARVELGYVNRYPYRWAGRRVQATMNRDLDLFAPDTAGTDFGTDRTTTDWVHVLDAPLPVAGGTLRAGAHEVPLRLPSWSPGSSESLVRWEVRLHVERSGRDLRAAEAFEVVVPPPDAPAGFADERLDGTSSDVSIALDRDWWLPGEQLRGRVAVAPRVDLGASTLTVRLQRTVVSHPLVRTPGDTLIIDGPVVTIAEDAPLAPGVEATVPFAIDVPGDAAPSTETVHASLGWFVRVSVEPRRFTPGGPDRVRRGFGVHTAVDGPRSA
ncbi:hypothetical protein [Patulibacter minatonensis]|uniref:hypothetical protein n=1 Tax=Patulibacter minatonensis TaxID=298163 RepID=UPI00047C9ECE|nr:hypothetical protein [Patulibacter minatonensis]